MKIPNIEDFYFKIEKNINLCEAYTEIDNLAKIIRMCRLKPFDNNIKKIQLINKWIDEYGNSLIIKKNKTINIIYNDLSIPITNHSTDLYFNLSLNKVIKMSTLFYIIKTNRISLLSLMGMDNYLRCYLLDGDMNYAKISPLYLGIHKIKNVIKYQDIKLFTKPNDRSKFIFPDHITDEWISRIPFNTKFEKILQNDVTMNQLKNNLEIQ